MASTKITISNSALALIGERRITTLADETEEARIVALVYDDVRDEVLTEHPWTFALKRAVLPAVVTGATQASPVVVTAVAHGFTDADEVKITSVLGMTELNGNTYKIANKADDTFELTDPDDDTDIDGTDYTAYTSGGFARKIDAPLYTDDGVTMKYPLPSDFLQLYAYSDKSALVKLEGTKLLSDTEELKILYVYQNDDPDLYTSQFKRALITRLAAEIAYNMTDKGTLADMLYKKYISIDLIKAMSIDSQQGTPTVARADEWINARFVGAGSYIKDGQNTWHPE